MLPGACISISRLISAGGALFPYLESMANQSFGMVIGAGGADTMIKAMVGRLSALGGQVHLNSEVAEVLRRDGRALGIRLSSGETIGARRAVIAGVTPRALAGRLLPGGSGDSSYDAGAQKFRFGPGTMMLHLAMSGLPDWTAGEELKRFAYVHRRARSRDDGARLFGGYGGPAPG